MNRYTISNQRVKKSSLVAKTDHIKTAIRNYNYQFNPGKNQTRFVTITYLPYDQIQTAEFQDMIKQAFEGVSNEYFIVSEHPAETFNILKAKYEESATTAHLHALVNSDYKNVTINRKIVQSIDNPDKPQFDIDVRDCYSPMNNYLTKQFPRANSTFLSDTKLVHFEYKMKV